MLSSLDKINDTQLVNKIKKAMCQDATKEYQDDFKKYIVEYCRRRNIDMSFLPKTFLSWIKK